MSKLQKKPSALKREHPALQNMKFLYFFLLLLVIFALLDPDPDSEYGFGSTDPIESGSGSATLHAGAHDDQDPDLASRGPHGVCTQESSLRGRGGYCHIHRRQNSVLQYSISVLPFRDVYPGSDYFPIPDPHQRI
jgi:hypothetical protein